MSQYKTGSVAVTNGSAAVVGTGTLWASNAAAGQTFMINGAAVPYVVGSVNSDTSITLSSNYAGATQSGLSYEINTSRTPVFGFDYMEQKDIDTATTFKRAMFQIEKVLTGGVSYPTLTASAPYNISQTWNNGAVTFDALTVNITNTASAAASRLINLLVGGVSQFSVTETGLVTLSGNVALGAGYISYGGTAAGLSFSSGNTAAFSAAATEQLQAISTVAAGGAGLRMSPASSSGALRDWGLVAYNSAPGDCALLVGATKGSDPASGTTVQSWTAAGIQFNQMTSATWVTGDKYLVIDASGNIHRSAVGPAS